MDHHYCWLLRRRSRIQLALLQRRQIVSVIVVVVSLYLTLHCCLLARWLFTALYLLLQRLSMEGAHWFMSLLLSCFIPLTTKRGGTGEPDEMFPNKWLMESEIKGVSSPRNEKWRLGAGRRSDFSQPSLNVSDSSCNLSKLDDDLCAVRLIAIRVTS